ncbi:septation protein SepH [Aeromicrobium sp. Leaf350]|uniref:septation protein SepH n=1 Tax=Aeromicrobium sp. Leaf350 TaxID=2876565 RepID=UPI001E4F2A07|nr:septation protein SepH [Aeromicrobium sp. Leaf350]
MRELGPDRLSDDGNSLVARDPGTGEEFSLPIDDRLKRIVALADHRRRPGYRPRESTKSGETIMQSALSPRDIQTRIRRGETVAEVADAAGVPTEQIDGFATPVLAERAYMAEQARATPLRRKHVGGAPVALGAIVDECLAAAGSPPDDAAWDAWRREDGRWAVIVTPTGESAAHFIFDVKSRFVLPADDLAHGLVGDVAHPDESSDMALADAVRGQGTSAAEGEVVTAAQVVAEDYATSAPVASLKEARDRRALEQMAQVEPPSDDQHPDQLDFGDLDHGSAEPTPEPEETPVRDETPPPPVDDEPAAPADDKRKHERRRVPSWDEIMFGGRDG